MRIAVDAMGGDHAPSEIVLGAIQASSVPGFAHEIVLVGDQAAIEASINENGGQLSSALSVKHASEIIEMHEHPAQAMKRKRDSSLVVCGQMVKSGDVAATISAGNTGAAMAIGIFDIGRIPGIERPAIATTLPTSKGKALLVDAGANVDCTPAQLTQFAIMGSVYAKNVLKLDNPTVGLLNVGAEEGKGNELTKAAYPMLKDAPINFTGNIEGKDVWEHAVDVIVCDGFAGNILLKTAEGFADWMVHMIKAEAKAGSQDEQIAVKNLLGRLFTHIDWSEYGGAPLLGVNGVTLISHGRSKAKAIASGINQAIAAAESGFVAAISNSISHI
jgi:glycerol-3-phosphate acyltransferase PlsX